MTGIEFLLPLIGGKVIGGLKEKKAEEDAEKSWNLWVKQKEFIDAQDDADKLEQRIYTEKYEKEKRDEKREYETSPENLANIQMKKFVESQASFDVTVKKEGYTSLMFDDEGKKLPFSVYAPLVTKKIVEKKRNDQLKDLAQQAGIDITQPNWEASYQNLITQQPKGMTLEKQNQMSEDSALRKLAQGVGIDVSKPSWRTDYSNFVKGTSKGMTLEEQKNLEIETATKKDAIQAGIDVSQPDWKTKLQTLRQGQSAGMTLKQEETAKTELQITNQKELNKLADARDKVLNTEYTLFDAKNSKSALYDGVNVQPFIMTFEDTKGNPLSNKKRLDLHGQYITNHFDNTARATGGLQNPDMLNYVYKFRDDYLAYYEELRSKTSDTDFRPNSLITSAAVHPYFKTIINRIHKGNNNLKDLFQTGAVLKAVGEENVIPIVKPSVATITDKDGQYTVGGHEIDYSVVDKQYHKTYLTLANEIELNRDIAGDSDALLSGLSLIAGPRQIRGQVINDTSVIGFVEDLLSENFRIEDFRAIDPQQRTAMGNPYVQNDSFKQALVRKANTHFVSPAQAIDALAIGVKLRGATSATTSEEYAKQNGIDLQAHDKETSDANGIISIVNQALTSVPDMSLNKQRKDNPESAYYLQVGGQDIRANADATDLFSKPLSVFTTLFSTIPNQFNVAVSELSELQVIEKVKKSYETGQDSLRWLNYSTAVNEKTGKRFIQEEAERRGMSVSNFIKAEEKSSKFLKNELDSITNTLADNGASEAARGEARKKFYLYTLSYKLASLLQGGTGGRTISDQDVENMFKVLSNESLTSSEKFITSMVNIKKMAVNVKEMNEKIRLGLAISPNDDFKTPQRPFLVAGQYFKNNLAGTFMPTYENVAHYLIHKTLNKTEVDKRIEKNENLEPFFIPTEDQKKNLTPKQLQTLEEASRIVG